MCIGKNTGFWNIVYNEHKKYKRNEKKLSKTLAFPWFYVMIELAKLYLAKIKNSKEGRARQTDFWWGPGVFLDAKYLFIRSCSVGPRDSRWP